MPSLRIQDFKAKDFERIFNMPTFRMPVGYYCMQAVGSQNIHDKKLSSAKFSGLVLREAWDKFNPAPGKYNYSFLDEQVARCERLNKKIILSLYSGSNAPAWLYLNGVKEYQGIPYPWDTKMHEYHGKAVAALGRRYSTHQLITAVEISGPTNSSNELHLASGLTKVAGYSISGMIDAWETCFDQYKAAFKECGLLSCGGNANQGQKAPITRAFFEYLLQEAPQQAIISHCALKANITVSAAHHALVVEYSKKGLYTLFEMVGPSLGGTNGEKGKVARFGGSFATAINIGNKAYARAYKVYQADEKEIKLAIDVPNPTPPPTPVPPTPKVNYGEVAYNAYSQAVKDRSPITGKVLPAWSNISDSSRQLWINATNTV